MSRRGSFVIKGWQWFCVTPGVHWEVSTGQYLFFTDGGWWLMGDGAERHMAESFREAAINAAPLLRYPD